MNIGSCEIIDLKATTTSSSSSRIAYETNDLSTNNSNLNHNTVKISHTISNHEQNGGNVSAAAAKAINGENLEDKKRKLRLPLLNSSPNNNNTEHNNSTESINDSNNNDSSMSFLNTLNSNEQTNKRHKAIFNNGLINLPPYLSSSLSVNETPSLNKDLIKHLDQTNNLSTPQIDKLINEYGNSMNSAMKTPGSALAVFNGNNIYFSLTPQLDMNLYTEYSQLNSNKTNDSITPGTSSIVNPNAIFPIINQVNGSNGVMNGTSINSGATSAAAVTAATVVIAPTSISNKNNNNNYATLTNVQQQHHHQNNNNNNNSNTGNFVQIQTNTSTNQNNIYGDINNNNILTNKIMNIKDEKDFTLQTVPVHPNNYNRPTSTTTTSNQKQTRLKQTNNNKQTKSTSIINRQQQQQQQQQQPIVATSVTVDTYNDSITSTTTPNSSSFNSRRDTGNSTTSSSSNLDTSFSPINFDKQETLKLEKKRERNREAARKCRTRKLEKIATLEIQVKNLTETNEAEKAKTDKLREEINIIRVKLEQHKKIHNCDLKLNI